MEGSNKKPHFGKRKFVKRSYPACPPEEMISNDATPEKVDRIRNWLADSLVSIDLTYDKNDTASNNGHSENNSSSDANNRVDVTKFSHHEKQNDTVQPAKKDNEIETNILSSCKQSGNSSVISLKSIHDGNKSPLSRLKQTQLTGVSGTLALESAVGSSNKLVHSSMSISSDKDIEEDIELIRESDKNCSVLTNTPMNLATETLNSKTNARFMKTPALNSPNQQSTVKKIVGNENSDNQAHCINNNKQTVDENGNITFDRKNATSTYSGVSPKRKLLEGVNSVADNVHVCNNTPSKQRKESKKRRPLKKKHSIATSKKGICSLFVQKKNKSKIKTIFGQKRKKLVHFFQTKTEWPSESQIKEFSESLNLSQFVISRWFHNARKRQENLFGNISDIVTEPNKKEKVKQLSDSNKSPLASNKETNIFIHPDSLNRSKQSANQLQSIKSKDKQQLGTSNGCHLGLNLNGELSQPLSHKVVKSKNPVNKVTKVSNNKRSNLLTVKLPNKFKKKSCNSILLNLINAIPVSNTSTMKSTLLDTRKVSKTKSSTVQKGKTIVSLAMHDPPRVSRRCRSLDLPTESANVLKNSSISKSKVLVKSNENQMLSTTSNVTLRRSKKQHHLSVVCNKLNKRLKRRHSLSNCSNQLIEKARPQYLSNEFSMVSNKRKSLCDTSKRMILSNARRKPNILSDPKYSQQQTPKAQKQRALTLKSSNSTPAASNKRSNEENKEASYSFSGGNLKVNSNPNQLLMKQFYSVNKTPSNEQLLKLAHNLNASYQNLKMWFIHMRRKEGLERARFGSYRYSPNACSWNKLLDVRPCYLHLKKCDKFSRHCEEELEKYYEQRCHPSSIEVKLLSKDLKLPQEYINLWFRNRQARNKAVVKIKTEGVSNTNIKEVKVSGNCEPDFGSIYEKPVRKRNKLSIRADEMNNNEMDKTFSHETDSMEVTDKVIKTSPDLYDNDYNSLAQELEENRLSDVILAEIVEIKSASTTEWPLVISSTSSSAVSTPVRQPAESTVTLKSPETLHYEKKLEEIFIINQNPSLQEMEMISKLLDMEIFLVVKWFTEERKRQKK